MSNQAKVKLITLDAMPGAHVTTVHGFVLGRSLAQTRAPEQKTMRAPKTASGRSSWEAQDAALESLRDAAAGAGANAVLGIRLDSVSTCEGTSVDVVAYGTAVTVEPAN